MIVEIYKFGNTIVRIHDSAIVKTQEEVDAILARISDIARRPRTGTDTTKVYKRISKQAAGDGGTR